MQAQDESAGGWTDPGRDRDRKVRRARRLGAGVVAAGVAGSFGFAAVAAISTPPSTSSASARPAPYTVGTTGQLPTFSQWRQSAFGDDAGEGDDGRTPVAPAQQQPSGFTLLPATNAPVHATTSGS
jgi:hypothetical protein